MANSVDSPTNMDTITNRLTNGKISSESDFRNMIASMKLTTKDMETIKVMTHRLVAMLKNTSFYSQDCRLYLGGSFKKGTSLKNGSDADIIVFLPPPSKASTLDLTVLIKKTIEMKKLCLKELTDLFAKESGMKEDEWVEEGRKIKEEEELADTGPRGDNRPRVSMKLTRQVPSMDFAFDFDLSQFRDDKLAMFYNRANKYLITIEMTSEDGKLTLPFDILPVYDWERNYSSLFEMQQHFAFLKIPGFVSSNFTPFHTDFVFTRLESLGTAKTLAKDFIVAAKCWAKRDLRKEYHTAKFPSYAIELICLAIVELEAEREGMERLTLGKLFMKFLFVVKNHSSQLGLVSKPVEVVHQTAGPNRESDIVLAFSRLLNEERGLETRTTKRVTLPAYELDEIPAKIMDQYPQLVVDPANMHRNVASTVNWPEVAAAAKRTLVETRPLDEALWAELMEEKWSLKGKEVVKEEIHHGKTFTLKRVVRRY